jgi:hypothetical protein
MAESKSACLFKDFREYLEETLKIPSNGVNSLAIVSK